MRERFMPEQYMAEPQTEIEEAKTPEQELAESASKMTADQIEQRVVDIENRFREMDKIAGKPEELEKIYGANASQKLEQERNLLEQERKILYKERPQGVARQRVQEIEQQFREIDQLAGKPEELEKKYGANASQKLEEERAWLEELRKQWQIIGQELKDPTGLAKETPIKEPEFQILEPVDLIFEIQPKKKKKIKLEHIMEKHEWNALVKEVGQEQREQKDIRQGKEYTEFSNQFNDLGRDTTELPIGVDLSGHFHDFMDKVSRAGLPGTEQEKAAELIYGDIMTGRLELPVRDWEWQNDLANRKEKFNKMLLSDLTAEVRKTEDRLQEIEKKLKALEDEENFNTPVDRWHNLTLKHNFKVVQKLNKEYLNAVKNELNLEAKGKRKIELGKPEDVFKLPWELEEFPKVEIEEEEKLKEAA